MKIAGFLVFVLGLILQLWWLILIGIAMYESTKITWIAASTTHGNHHDHDP